MQDISKYKEEFEPIFNEWCGTENAPAGVTVQALCADPDYLLELALIVATD